MIKQAISELGLAPLAVLGLLLFVGIFVGVSVWAFTRQRNQVQEWSTLPLGDGAEPGRTPNESSGGCGKCADCVCKGGDSEPALFEINPRDLPQSA